VSAEQKRETRKKHRPVQLGRSVSFSERCRRLISSSFQLETLSRSAGTQNPIRVWLVEAWAGKLLRFFIEVLHNVLIATPANCAISDPASS
jgi:hypothetical protein